MPKHPPKRRMVIDTNYMANEELRHFLESSSFHYAVLTEFLGIETYKVNPLVGVPQSYQILKDFPRQVIVLKGSELTHTLIDRTSNPQRRLIDHDQTLYFATLCKSLESASDSYVRDQLLSLGSHADAHMQLMIRDAKKLAALLPDFLSEYDEAELTQLRKKEISPELARKVTRQIMMSTAERLRTAGIRKAPTFDELLDTLTFREMLCMHIWMLLKVGGTLPTNPAKIRNDVVDATFAAYATFFDGLLSKDAMPNEIYLIAASFLRVFKGS